jgi:hypothetical protein
LLKRYWWDKMAFDCKAYCQNFIVCNRAKPDRRGASSLHPLGVMNTHGKLLELIMSLVCLGVVHMVTHPYLLWYVILQRWHILFHVIRTLPLRNRVNYL